MRKIMVSLAAVAFFCMILFSSIGFAAVNDQLVVQGNISIEEPNYVYIKSSAVESLSSGSSATATDLLPTLLQSNVTLGNEASAEVRIRIDVKNNSRFEHTFDGIKYAEDLYDNPLISVTTVGITKGDKLAVNEEITFFAVFTYKDHEVPQNNALNSLLNFSFILSSEFVPDAAVGNAVERFSEILNNNFDYNELIAAMEDLPDTGRPDSSYIGNVIGSSGKDSQFLHDLFTKNENGALNDYLTLTVGDQTVDVTVIIKREDADNNQNTQDITLYLTPETPSGKFWTRLGFIYVDRQNLRSVLSPVYAVVFRFENDNWIQITPLFEGKAGETCYGDKPSDYNAICDSFNTNTWESTQRYWNLGSGKNISDLTQAAIANGYVNES